VSTTAASATAVDAPRFAEDVQLSPVPTAADLPALQLDEEEVTPADA